MSFDDLTAYLDKSVEKYKLPAVDICISQGFETVYRYQKNCNDTSMYIGYSTSKLFEGAAIAKLVSDGVIDLNTPAYEYIPEMRELSVYKKDKTGMIVGSEKLSENNPVRIKHLATMCSGVADNIWTEYINSAIESGKKSTQDIVRAILREPLKFEPGTEYKYGLSLDVLAAVIEAATGKKYAQYLHDEFFEPLEMSDTTFRPSEEQKSRLLQQYMWYGPGNYYYMIPNDNQFIFTDEYDSGGAGAYFTANDLMKFAIALANGGVGVNGCQIISSEAIDLMRTPALSEDTKHMFQTWLGFPGYSYGLCVRTMCEPEKPGYTTPVGEFGWQGKGGTYVSICPEKKASFFMGIQVCDYHPVNEMMHNELRDMVYDLLP